MTLRTKTISRDDPSSLIKFNILQDHIRQDDLFDEELMQVMYLAAVDCCEKYTNRFFTEAKVVGYMQELKSRTVLPYSPNTVTSVKAKSRDSKEAVEIPFVYNKVSEELILNDVNNKGWYDVEIEYSCGYLCEELPWVIKQAILMTFGTMYNVREDISYGVSVNALSFNSKMLLDPYRIPYSGG